MIRSSPLEIRHTCSSANLPHCENEAEQIPLPKTGRENVPVFIINNSAANCLKFGMDDG